MSDHIHSSQDIPAVGAPDGSRSLSLDDTLALMSPLVGPKDPIPANTEVAIVGAGPVGLTAAVLLAHYGIDVVLLEKNETTSALPRAIAIDDEYMRLLKRFGLGEAMRGHTSPPFGIHFISPFGIRLVTVPGFVTPNGSGNRNAIIQPVFEKILLHRLRQGQSAKIHFGADVTDVKQSEDGVSLTIAGNAGSHQLKAKFLLGCDGAKSFVRSALNVPFDGKRIDAPHLVVDLADFPDQANHSRFFCNPSRPVNSIPAPYGGRRLEFMLSPNDDHKSIVMDAGIQELVDKHTPYAGVPLHIIRRAIYGFSERIVQAMQIGRIYLLGDAAHVMPPFGGQGMNSGARDAANLTWKIAGVLRGQLNSRILDTYEKERQRHIRQIVKYSVWIGRLANIRSWPLALLRDLVLGALNAIPPVRRYFSSMRYMPKPYIDSGFVEVDSLGEDLVGRPFPFLSVTDGSGVSFALDDITGPEFALVGFGVDPDWFVKASSYKPWPMLAPKLVSISDRQQDNSSIICVRPADEKCLSVLASCRGKIVAIRPDGYVAWVGSSRSAQSAFASLNEYANQ